MTRKRTIGTRAALGGLTAAVALIAAQPAAQADEVSDLRANQELLQQRIDQLAQSGIPARVSVRRRPAGGPVNVQMTGGSFPRSFLIPGTDTSIRVGGEIRMLSAVLDHRRQPERQRRNHQRRHHRAAEHHPAERLPRGSTGWIARSAGDNVLNMSPQQSKLSVETRTPTAWGEARTFIEFDFGRATPRGQHETACRDLEQPAAPPALRLRHARSAAVRPGELELQRSRRRRWRASSSAV